MVRIHRSAPAAPHERGRAFGAAEAGRIAATLAAYRAMWDARAGRPYDPSPAGEGALAAIRAFAPDLAEEIEGIALGAGIEPRLMAALNARTEILATLPPWGGEGAASPTAGRGECSVVAALRPGRPPVAVQTWDWFHRFRDHWLVWEIAHEDGRVTRTLTEYGILGKAGMNDRGLGLLFTILHHRRDGAFWGLPVHVAARAALDRAGSVHEAAELLASAPVSASSSMTLTGWDGERGAAMAVELFPGGPGYRLPGPDGVLVHTNHFLAPGARGQDAGPGVHPDTLLREDMLARALRGGVDGPRPILRAMNSHMGGDSALCAHPVPGTPEADQYETLSVIVLDPAEAGGMRVHAGGPCTHPLARRG